MPFSTVVNSSIRNLSAIAEHLKSDIKSCHYKNLNRDEMFCVSMDWKVTFQVTTLIINLIDFTFENSQKHLGERKNVLKRNDLFASLIDF